MPVKGKFFQRKTNIIVDRIKSVLDSQLELEWERGHPSLILENVVYSKF